MFTVPVVLDIFRNGSNLKTEENSLQFLDWVIAYRRARAFNEIHRDTFRNQKVNNSLNTDTIGDRGFKHG